MRDATSAKINKNEELTNLMKALGLKPGSACKLKDGEVVTGGKKGGGGLRYGRLMLMADQDADGSHIKGLVINLIHHFWPELLGANFVQEFVTPLLKARRLSDGSEAAFFSLRWNGITA